MDAEADAEKAAGGQAAGAAVRVTACSAVAESAAAVAGGDDVVLNNEFLSSVLHELLQHVEATGEFITSYRPFHILGIGNGACVGTRFATRFAAMPMYRSLRALVSINGFAHVDSQLAAILHSSTNVLSCFPPSRPDLPVSYFTRFLFSDSYLQRVDPNLVRPSPPAHTCPVR